MRVFITALTLGLLAVACSRTAQQIQPKWIEYGIAANPVEGVPQPTTSYPYYAAGHPPTERVDVLTPVQRCRVGEAKPTIDVMGFPAVYLVIDSRDAAQFEAFTAANVDRPLVILVDGRVTCLATINEKLPGQLQLFDEFTEAEVKQLVEALQ